ncbi:MAG TPA: WYL domain-containing protein [Beijerinckiaceae bacterium]
MEISLLDPRALRSPTSYGPRLDTPAELDVHAAEEHDFGQVLLVEYQDAAGAASERTIHVRDVFELSGNIYVDAHCYLRDAPRRFRADRITMAASARTGEVIPDPFEFFAHMARVQREPFVSHGRAARPKAQELKRLRESTRPAFVLLIGMARSDGRFCQAEKEVFSRLVGERAIQIGANEETAVAFTLEMGAVIPTRRMLKLALGRVRADLAEREWLAAAIHTLASADKTICKDELATLRNLVAWLGAPIATAV